MFEILVVEDDPSARRWMEVVLRDAGYHPYCAECAEQALDIIEHRHIDLMVTDIMMPGIDGYQLTEMIREADRVLPILMITAKEAPKDRKKGFLVGTDDYMVKPVDDEEMLLRIKSLLRRVQIVNERRIMLGAVTLSYDSLTVSRDDQHITLPQKEFYLLYKLLSYPNVIFTRIQLMDEIWGVDSDSDARTVNVHINRLRERFLDWPEFDIITVRGLGYKAVRNAQ
ncbi:MAG: response regulator transcription factor [Oscillospiraceae bacterium]|jgi:DNA-binding response OmpR family regulator|nr:response regulator transcription factor [Oscillospiraceae bacterium]